MTELAREIITI